ncbi:uncharacterized protein LOC120332610 isoform X1 [Styela clava]
MYFAAQQNHVTQSSFMAGQSSMGIHPSNDNANKGLAQVGFVDTQQVPGVVPYPATAPRPGNFLLTSGNLSQPFMSPMMIPSHINSKMAQFMPGGILQSNLKIGHNQLYGSTVTPREPVNNQSNTGVSWPSIRPQSFEISPVIGGQSAIMPTHTAPQVDNQHFPPSEKIPPRLSAVVQEGSLGAINGMQLGPVEKAVLHQAMYNQSKIQTPAMRRCDNCNVIFNSQMQAEMHYKGKKHAKVMYLKRCKETKVSPTKLRDSTIAIMEKGNWNTFSNSEEETPVSTSDTASVAIGPKMADVGSTTITDIYTGSHIIKNVPTFSTNKNYYAADNSTTQAVFNHSQETSNEIQTGPKMETTENLNQNQCMTIGDESSPQESESIHNINCGAESQPVSSSCILEVANGTEDESKLSETTAFPQREPVVLPDPLPSYIKRIERPAVLKESLRCNVCDIYVNSENQMKQHVNSLRHKNIEQGIPTPPKPTKEDKPKTKAEQFRCEVCKVTLNSDIQLLQHLSSQRHKNMLEGRPPKPRWTPYERTQHALLRSAAHLRLSLKTIPNQTSPLLIPAPISNSSASTLPIAAQPSAIHPTVLAQNAPTHLKQTAFIAPDGSILQTREVVFVGTGGQAFTPTYSQQLAAPGPHQLIQPHHIRTQAQPELAQILNTQCIGFDPRKLGIEWTVQ